MTTNNPIATLITSLDLNQGKALWFKHQLEPDETTPKINFDAKYPNEESSFTHHDNRTFFVSHDIFSAIMKMYLTRHY